MKIKLTHLALIVILPMFALGFWIGSIWHDEQVSSPGEVRETIAFLEECRDIHKYLASEPERLFDGIGDLKYHLAITEKYDQAIRVVKGLK